jgi:thiamine phosphate synthase YjbQ (UPF0047 family)
MLTLLTRQIHVSLKTGIDLINITDQVDRLVAESAIKAGSANLHGDRINRVNYDH